MITDTKQLNMFASEYAAVVQDTMKDMYDIDISHRECWEIVTSHISTMFPNELIECETINELCQHIIDETGHVIHHMIVAKYSTIH